MRFADIPGHEDVKERLRDMALSGRIPHALLLEGPSGAGKFMLARAFAQFIHCQNRTADGDSCGRCPACLQHSAFNHIDTVFSFPVVKKSGKPTMSDDHVEDFRAFMTENPYMDFDKWLLAMDNINAQPQIYVEEGNELLRRLTFMARRSQYKVVLLWLPERMMEGTANKLLKLVEEPFADTIFVMVSNNSRRILPTIYSRTQRINVRRYSDTEVQSILEARGVPPTDAADAARIAEGDTNMAIRLAEAGAERMQQLELFASLMRKAYGRKVGELREWSKTVAELGREPAMKFLDYCSRLFRESFVMHLQVDNLLTLNAAERAFTSKFFPFINERNVIDLMELFDRSKRDIAGNGNAKIIFFDLAVRTIMLIRRQ